MTRTEIEAYKPRTWPLLKGLHGISDRTLEVHFGLYEGYVKNTNLLNEQLAELAGKDDPLSKLAFSELNRRRGFEYNGMVLHQYYFDNMTASGSGRPSGGRLHDAVRASFGDLEGWLKDFAAVGAMRGVGWAIAYQDLSNGRITNHWISDHEDGHVSGFAPILVMDVWEHAFMFDYKPAERSKYIEAFFANVDWQCVTGRLSGSQT